MMGLSHENRIETHGMSSKSSNEMLQVQDAEEVDIKTISIKRNLKINKNYQGQGQVLGIWIQRYSSLQCQENS